jgi:hypothetical protein
MTCAQHLNITSIYWYIGWRRSSRSSALVLYPRVQVLQAKIIVSLLENHSKFDVRADLWEDFYNEKYLERDLPQVIVYRQEVFSR